MARCCRAGGSRRASDRVGREAAAGQALAGVAARVCWRRMPPRYQTCGTRRPGVNQGTRCPAAHLLGVCCIAPRDKGGGKVVDVVNVWGERKRRRHEADRAGRLKGGVCHRRERREGDVVAGRVPWVGWAAAWLPGRPARARRHTRVLPRPSTRPRPPARPRTPCPWRTAVAYTSAAAPQVKSRGPGSLLAGAAGAQRLQDAAAAGNRVGALILAELRLAVGARQLHQDVLGLRGWAQGAGAGPGTRRQQERPARARRSRQGRRPNFDRAGPPPPSQSPHLGHVLLLAGPRLEGGRLERAAVGEGEAPRRVGAGLGGRGGGGCGSREGLSVCEGAAVGAWLTARQRHAGRAAVWRPLDTRQPPLLPLRRTSCSACRLSVDSSSDMPPDRKWMPGTAGGMERSMVRVVYCREGTAGRRGEGVERRGVREREGGGERRRAARAPLRQPVGVRGAAASRVRADLGDVGGRRGGRVQAGQAHWGEGAAGEGNGGSARGTKRRADAGPLRRPRATSSHAPEARPRARPGLTVGLQQDALQHHAVLVEQAGERGQGRGRAGRAQPSATRALKPAVSTTASVGSPPGAPNLPT
jgi:hypothetical protein